MFPKVKNVNVESPKKRSKLLIFFGGSLPQPLPKGKGFSISPLMPISCLVNRRVKETKSQRDEEAKRLRVEESKSQRD